MDKVAMVKKEILLQDWSETELARQESGLTILNLLRNGSA